MKTLWAPWRMKYIQEDAGEEKTEDASECIFCPRIAATDDATNLIVARRPLSVVFMNKYPYNGGHALIMPSRHVADMDDLDDPELLELFDTVRITKRAIDAVMSPHGYNIGINLGLVAGAGVPGHLHVHVVPRWNGDTNFMPVFGDVKVIPEDVHVTRDKLAEAFARITQP